MKRAIFVRSKTIVMTDLIENQGKRNFIELH